MNILLDPTLWVAFAMLSTLEVVLGIDNIIFLTILVGRLPPAQRAAARRLGLGFAMLTRVLLLLSLSWVMGLTADLVHVAGHTLSGRDLVLLGGGAFLLWKSAQEIFVAVERGDAPAAHGRDGEAAPGANAAQSGPVPAGWGRRFWSVIAQIAVIDIVFSLDSVITAVGMVDQVGVMIAAVVFSALLMMLAARHIGEFVERHPSVKVLALAFLVMVGTTLVAEAFDVHVPKLVIYAAMGFSLVVEMLNIRARARRGARPIDAGGTPAA